MKVQEYPIIEGFGVFDVVCDDEDVWFNTRDVLAALGVKAQYMETALSWINGRYRKTINDVDYIDKWGIFSDVAAAAADLCRVNGDLTAEGRDRMALKATTLARVLEEYSWKWVNS